MLDKGTAETSPHYNKLGTQQPILVMLREFSSEEFAGYLKGNALKYTLRKGLKEGTNDEAKAEQYQKWYREYLFAGGITIGETFYEA